MANAIDDTYLKALYQLMLDSSKQVEKVRELLDTCERDYREIRERYIKYHRERGEYLTLLPDDVLRVGDEAKFSDMDGWFEVCDSAGSLLGSTLFVSARRPVQPVV